MCYSKSCARNVPSTGTAFNFATLEALRELAGLLEVCAPDLKLSHVAALANAVRLTVIYTWQVKAARAWVNPSTYRDG